MSYDIVQEDVPDFVKRIGDRVIQGSNNAIIVLGTDRAAAGPASIDDGLGSADSDGGGKGTGTIHAVVGRADSDGDPDLVADSAYLYLTMKSKVDTNLGLGKVEASTDDVPGAILKSDAVRVVYRKDLKICLSDGSNYIFMDNKKIVAKVGNNTATLDGNQCDIVVGQAEAKLDANGVALTMGGSSVKITQNGVDVDGPVIRLGADGAKYHPLMAETFLPQFDAHLHATAVGPSDIPAAPLTPQLTTLAASQVLSR